MNSNAVELIVSILALVKGEVDIVQESLIGSILSNLLLVMGMCFFFGGLNRVEQHFNVTVAQTASSLLALAVGSLIIPAAFQAWADGTRKSLLVFPDGIIVTNTGYPILRADKVYSDYGDFTRNGHFTPCGLRSLPFLPA